MTRPRSGVTRPRSGVTPCPSSCRVLTGEDSRPAGWAQGAFRVTPGQGPRPPWPPATAADHAMLWPCLRQAERTIPCSGRVSGRPSGPCHALAVFQAGRADHAMLLLCLRQAERNMPCSGRVSGRPSSPCRRSTLLLGQLSCTKARDSRPLSVPLLLLVEHTWSQVDRGGHRWAGESRQRGSHAAWELACHSSLHGYAKGTKLEAPNQPGYVKGTEFEAPNQPGYAK